MIIFNMDLQTMKDSTAGKFYVDVPPLKSFEAVQNLDSIHVNNSLLTCFWQPICCFLHFQIGLVYL